MIVRPPAATNFRPQTSLVAFSLTLSTTEYSTLVAAEATFLFSHCSLHFLASFTSFPFSISICPLSALLLTLAHRNYPSAPGFSPLQPHIFLSPMAVR